MDLAGLTNKVIEAAAAIDYGRKGFATRGKAEEGRLSYERGIAEALSAFRDAQSTADPRAIILVEYTFLNQELQFCVETDAEALGSLTQAVAGFDDAFLALEAVEDGALYRGAELTHPRDKKYRVSGFPKDSFHIACIAHRTRLRNTLRVPGMDRMEKALLKQRQANLSVGQGGYVAKQRKALQKGD